MTRRQIDDRTKRRALSLADSGRLTRQEIADQLGIGRSTVQKIIATRDKHGHKAVFSRKKDGPRRRLTPEEEKKVLSLIVNVPPASRTTRTKHPLDRSFVWTWKQVADLIETETGKKLSRSTVLRLLNKWGIWAALPNGPEVWRHALESCPTGSKLFYDTGTWRIGIVWVSHYTLPIKVDLWSSQETLKLIGRKDFTLLTGLYRRGERCFAVIAGAHSQGMVRFFAKVLQYEHGFSDSLYVLLPRTRSSKPSVELYDGIDASFEFRKALMNQRETWAEGE